MMDLTGSPDGVGYRAGVAVFDVMAGMHTAIGILAALAHRQRTGDGPAHRDEPAVQRAVRAGEPDLGLPGRRRAADPGRQRAPEHPSLRAVPDRRRRPGGHRRQRRPVRPAVRAARRAGARRPTPASSGTSTAPGTATSCTVADRAVAAAHGRGVVLPAHRRGRALRPDQHGRRGHRLRRAARPRPGGGTRPAGAGAPGPGCGLPDPAVRDARSHRLPPSGRCDSSGDEVRRWLGQAHSIQ